MTVTEDSMAPAESAHGYGLDDEQFERLEEALEQGNLPVIKELLQGLHPADIASVLHQVEPDSRKIIIELLREDFDPEILLNLEGEVKDEIINLLGFSESAAALNKLDVDEAVYVVEDLDDAERREIIEAIPDEGHRAEMLEGLSYPESSAGRLMQKEFTTIPESWNVGQAVDYLRAEQDMPDQFYELFVVDEIGKPVGSVTLSHFVRSKRDVPLKEIAKTNIITAQLTTDQEEIAHLFRRYALISMPVVNGNGVMVGVITLDDVVDIIQEETEEDMLRMGGISETDLYSAFIQTTKQRFPWLFINLLTAVLASLVIAQFEGTIQKMVILAAIMPIVASMGGNGGLQTATLAVRAIATRELTSANTLRIMGKETFVGFLNGLYFAVITAAAVFFIYHDLKLSIVLALAMIGNLTIAGFVGVLIPYFLFKAGHDPATSSSIILTTFTDVAGFFFFLGLAALLIG